MGTKVIISSYYLLNHLKDIDLDKNAVITVIIENGSMKFVLDSEECIECAAHHSMSGQTHFDATSYSFDRLIRVLKAIPEQPITLYFGTYLHMKMLF